MRVFNVRPTITHPCVCMRAILWLSSCCKKRSFKQVFPWWLAPMGFLGRKLQKLWLMQRDFMDFKQMLGLLGARF